MKHNHEVPIVGSTTQHTFYKDHESGDALFSIAAIIAAVAIVGGNLFALQRMIMGI